MRSVRLWSCALGTVVAVCAMAPPSRACLGDCNGDERVTVDELVRAVQIALGAQSVAECGAVDNNLDGEITVGELVRAVTKALVGCGVGAAGEVLLSVHDQRLDEQDLGTGAVTQLIPATRGQLTGQVCPLPGHAGNLVVGDDTDAPTRGWSMFSSEGTFITKLALGVAQDGQTRGGQPVGCAAAPDGRMFATATGEGNGAPGQLRVFFPPDYSFGCLIDGTLRAPGAIAIDADGAIYVPEAVAGGAVLRFAPPFPANPNECELALEVPQHPHTSFIKVDDDIAPRAVAGDGNGHWYVALSPPGAAAPGIREYAADGTFVREVLPSGDGGFPVALAFDGGGALYYADLGVAAGTAQGSLRRVAFDESGRPSPPELMARDLTRPHGVAVVPSRAGDWLTLGGSYRRAFFNPRERQINRDNAAQMVTKWKYQTGGMISAQPVTVTLDLPGEGPTRVVIVPSWDQYVYALRAENGSRVWRYQMKPQPGTFYPYSGTATIAWIDDQPRVFVPGGETLYCLDALTGTELWHFDAGSGCTTCTEHEERNEIESTPAVVNGLVIVGMDVNDGLPGKGGLFAVHADDGRLAWWFDLVTTKTCTPLPEDNIRSFDGFHSAEDLGLPADFFATRPGCDFDRLGVGCGNVWSSAAVDVRRGLFYTVSSNCDTDDNPNTPAPPPPMPPYEEAIFAVHIADGTPAWRWRPRDVDPDDFDFGAVPNLFEIAIDGRVRDVIGVGGKDGTYYVLDRDGVNQITGRVEPYWQTNVVPGGPAGGMIGAASVGDGRIVVATAPGFSVFDPQKPTVHAFDAASGGVLWENSVVFPSFGPTSGVPGLAFTGSTPAPYVNIFDANSGALLIRLLASTAISGMASAPTIVDGTMYTGGGTGAFNSGPDADAEARRDTPITALCVPGAPGCTPNTCDDHNDCTYDYRDRDGNCVSELAAENIDCKVDIMRGTCVAGACVISPPS